MEPLVIVLEGNGAWLPVGVPLDGVDLCRKGARPLASGPQRLPTSPSPRGKPPLPGSQGRGTDATAQVLLMAFRLPLALGQRRSLGVGLAAHLTGPGGSHQVLLMSLMLSLPPGSGSEIRTSYRKRPLPPVQSCPPEKAPHQVTLVPGHPCKIGIQTPMGVRLGSPLESGPGREFSFNFTLHTFVLFEVFTSMY